MSAFFYLYFIYTQHTSWWYRYEYDPVGVGKWYQWLSLSKVLKTPCYVYVTDWITEVVIIYCWHDDRIESSDLRMNLLFGAFLSLRHNWLWDQMCSRYSSLVAELLCELTGLTQWIMVIAQWLWEWNIGFPTQYVFLHMCWMLYSLCVLPVQDRKNDLKNEVHVHLWIFVAIQSHFWQQFFLHSWIYFLDKIGSVR